MAYTKKKDGVRDKYSATWVSHSSMGDFHNCPRLYYLRAMYKNPKTAKKISVVAPALSLGVAVHNVLEGLGQFKAEERMDRDLRAWFEKEWEGVAGKKGGFTSDDQEAEYKARGVAMIETVVLKLPKEKMNPNFFLTDTIILNGLIDWIEYLPESDSLHLVDFKTGKNEEKEGSMQLPIYLLLCKELQKRAVTKASYWYLESNTIVEKPLPDVEEARAAIIERALPVRAARERAERERVEDVFVCPQGAGGCRNCRDFEAVVQKIQTGEGSAEYVGQGNFGQEMWFVG
jgi:PD-(D/E)XK nuclease superfamily